MVKSRFVRFSFIFAIVLLLALSPAAAFGRNPPGWAPAPVRNWGFDVLLAVSPQLKKVASIVQGPLQEMRAYVDHEGEPVSFQSGALSLAGTLYKPTEAGVITEASPGIILAHGSTHEGRKLGFYRILGKELSGRGYIVLSVDLRGYGDSEDLPGTDDISFYDYVVDLAAAVDYLTSLDSVNEESLSIIGHSAGAEPAIKAGILDPRIKKMIAIGPPRRSYERYGDEDKPEFYYFQRRMMRYMALSEPIPNEIFEQIIETFNIEQHIAYFSGPGHKPLLFIDGEKEDEGDLIYLRNFYNAMSEPKMYITLDGSDHYANTANWGNIVIYDPPVISELSDQIDRWLSE